VITLRKVILFSILLVFGVIGSQFLPLFFGHSYETVAHIIKLFTMVGLGFIMIHVGYEFDIKRSRLREYAWDYLVAATAAAFPWLFCCFYFIFVMSDQQLWSNGEHWKDVLLASRFAAPTSAGVLFSMLAAAGLAATWMYRKARILAIFDDLDTVLFMIPLQMMMVGFRWQLGMILLIVIILLWLAWSRLHQFRIPVTWPWVLGYSFGIGLACESIYLASKLINESVPIHVEILLPAFALGCLISRSQKADEASFAQHGNDEEDEDKEEDHVLARLAEKRASTIISACFMTLVGLSMPPLSGLAISGQQSNEKADPAAHVYAPEQYEDKEHAVAVHDAKQANVLPISWSVLAVHVLIITIISNLGKMFIVFCYRYETHWRNRLAVCVAMFPRGEVGAGVLVIALAYGIEGPILIVAMFSLALNLLLTGAFIMAVKYLIEQPVEHRVPAPVAVAQT
jgi:Kef-type K+ transport system membrane component KefB